MANDSGAPGLAILDTIPALVGLLFFVEVGKEPRSTSSLQGAEHGGLEILKDASKVTASKGTSESVARSRPQVLHDDVLGQLRRLPSIDDLALFKDITRAAYLSCELDALLRNEDRDPRFFEPAHHTHDLVNHDGRQALENLVHEQKLRVLH